MKKKLISCPKCDKIQDEGSRYCVNCGFEMIPPKINIVSVCPKCGEVYSKDINYCPNDGAELAKLDKKILAEPSTDLRAENFKEINEFNFTKKMLSAHKHILIRLPYELSNLIANIIYNHINNCKSNDIDPITNTNEEINFIREWLIDCNNIIKNAPEDIPIVSLIMLGALLKIPRANELIVFVLYRKVKKQLKNPAILQDLLEKIGLLNTDEIIWCKNNIVLPKI